MYVRAQDQPPHPSGTGPSSGSRSRKTPGAEGHRPAASGGAARARSAGVRGSAGGCASDSAWRDGPEALLAERREQQGMVEGEEAETREGARGTAPVQAVDGGGGEEQGFVEAA